MVWEGDFCAQGEVRDGGWGGGEVGVGGGVACGGGRGDGDGEGIVKEGEEGEDEEVVAGLEEEHLRGGGRGCCERMRGQMRRFEAGRFYLLW